MSRSALGYTRFKNRVLCLDDFFSIDIREWRRDNVLHCRLFEYIWRRQHWVIGRIYFQLSDNVDAIDYRLLISGVTELKGSLSLTTTPCNYGGKRYWFKCPRCQRNVAKLFFYSRAFQCRLCCSLPYKSQNETPSDRNIRRVRSVRRLLGASDNIFDPISSKPIGMHWNRFETLINKANDLSSIEALFRAKIPTEY